MRNPRPGGPGARGNSTSLDGEVSLSTKSRAPIQARLGKAYRLNVGRVSVESVTVGDRLRSLDPDKVAMLAESMDAIGLQHPINVIKPDGEETLHLVAGHHRLEAARKLGWQEIDFVFVGLVDSQLWEIDENLCRSDLTAGERAQHMAKRTEVVRQQSVFAEFAETDSGQSQNAQRGQGKLVADIAKATGRSKRSVEADKARGKNIAADVQKEIAGTTIEDSGVQLDALAKATPEEQREAVRAVNLCKWWKKADKTLIEAEAGPPGLAITSGTRPPNISTPGSTIT